MNLENILLFEHSPEALEAVKCGKAIVSSGGIRRKGESGSGFLEHARPAIMSVADFQSLFEGREHALETDEHLHLLDSQLALSTEVMKKIEDIGWLNNAAIQRTYTLTYEGFIKTLHGLEQVSQQLSELESYVKNRDNKQFAQVTQTYINYLRSDAGDLRSKRYNVTNGKISDHLDQISAMIKSLLLSAQNMEGDQYVTVQVLTELLPPFAYIVRRYSSLYYYENDGEFLPGNYNEWVNVIYSVIKSKQFKENLEYYIHLKLSIPFKDKVYLKRKLLVGMREQLLNIVFDRNYIKNHSKDEYLSIDEQIRQKIESKDYYVEGRNVVIFLDRMK